MSQPVSVNPDAPAATPAVEVPKEKPRFSVYTMMLILSFLFVTTATFLMSYELERWGDYPWWNTSEADQPVNVGGPAGS